MSIVTYNNRSIANISAIPGAAKSLTHIKTLTASSSSTISFVNGSSDVVLDSTYPIYLFKLIQIHPANDSTPFEFNGSIDGGSNYNVVKTSSGFATYHQEDGSDGAVAYAAHLDEAQATGDNRLMHNVGADNDEAGSGELFLFNPSSTTFVKHFIYRGIDTHKQPAVQDNFTAGYFNTTSAINAIIFRFETGNIDAGTIKLYGLKDS
jgi:hypothetical protein